MTNSFILTVVLTSKLALTALAAVAWLPRSERAAGWGECGRLVAELNRPV